MLNIAAIYGFEESNGVQVLALEPTALGRDLPIHLAGRRLQERPDVARRASSWPDDVSPDGQRFLLLKDARTPDGQKPAAPEIHLVQHWAEELKAKVPAGK